MCRSDAIMHTVFYQNFGVLCVIGLKAHQLCCHHLVLGQQLILPSYPRQVSSSFAVRLREILDTRWALPWHSRSPKAEFPTHSPWKVNAKRTWAEENDRVGIRYEFFLTFSLLFDCQGIIFKGLTEFFFYAHAFPGKFEEASSGHALLLRTVFSLDYWFWQLFYIPVAPKSVSLPSEKWQHWLTRATRREREEIWKIFFLPAWVIYLLK